LCGYKDKFAIDLYFVNQRNNVMFCCACRNCFNWRILEITALYLSIYFSCNKLILNHL